MPICSIIVFFLNLLLFANSNIGRTIIFPFWLYVGMGNEKSNSYWEAELPPNYDRVGIENFIRAKYPLPLLLVSSPLIFILALLYAFSFMPLFLFAWPYHKVQFPFKLVNVGFSGMKRGDGFLGIQSQNHHLRHMKRRLPFPCRELGIEVIIITPII